MLAPPALVGAQPPAGFSNPLFATLVGQWQDWKRGIPPGREWKARGSQNPRLLLAFQVLDRAENRAQGAARPSPARQQQESPDAFRTRIMREMGGARP